MPCSTTTETHQHPSNHRDGASTSFFLSLTKNLNFVQSLISNQRERERKRRDWRSSVKTDHHDEMRQRSRITARFIFAPKCVEERERERKKERKKEREKERENERKRRNGRDHFCWRRRTRERLTDRLCGERGVRRLAIDAIDDVGIRQRPASAGRFIRGGVSGCSGFAVASAVGG